MNNPFDETRAAVDEAAIMLAAVDDIAGSMASLLIGRLKHVPSWHLEQLKHELRDFNIHTGRWKNE